MYRSYLERRKSPQTVAVYSYAVKRFIDYLNRSGVDLDRLTLADVEGFLSSLRVSDRSLALYSFALASFLEFVGRSDIARLVPVSKFTVREPPWLPEEAIRRIVDGEKDPMRKALILIGYELALRVNEALNLRWEDVDLDGRVVWVTRLKKKRVERKPKPISKELAELLSMIPRVCDYVFAAYGGKASRGWHRMSVETAERIFREAAERAGYKGYSYHVLRHSRATALAEKTGGNIVEMAKITDHDDPRSLMVYTHIALSRLRRIAEAK